MDLDIDNQRDDAIDNAQNTAVPDYFVDVLADINERYQPLVASSVGEWCGAFYRAQYEASETGDRAEPLCRCPDPRCSLKRGRLPYQLRRPTRDDETPHEQLQAFIRSHTQPVVIDEALTELDNELQEVEADLIAFNRAADSHKPEADGDAELPERLQPGADGTNTDATTPSPMGDD